MALQNITSGPFEGLLIRTSRESIKNTIIEGANPRLYSAMLQVAAMPIHVKKLNLESATELISILEDAETLEKVFEADKRVSVRESVNRRLVEIGARPAPAERARYVPTLSPAVTESTQAALRRPYETAIRILTNSRQYDENVVAAWAETVEMKAMPSLMGFVSRNNYYFNSGMLAKVVAKRLTALTAEELNQLLRGSKVPSSVFEAYMADRPRVIDLAVAVLMCHTEEYAVSSVLLSDENKAAFTVSDEAVAYWRNLPGAARYLLFAGALSVEELTKLLDIAELGDSSRRSSVMRYARNAKDVDYVVAEALRRDWWPATEAHFSYAYSTSEISAFLSVEGINEATALAIASRAANAHVVRYALGEWGTPHRSAYEMILSKISLGRISWFSDLDSAVQRLGDEQQLLSFARDFVARSTTLIDDVRQNYYGYGRTSNVFNTAITDVLYEKLGDNAVSWSMFLALCEDAEDVTLFDLAEAASSLA